jgi:MFS transporter, AAHS family, 4-hydroxybenzoate transporter
VGAIMTGFFCAYAIPHYGWRYAFLFAGFISLVMLVMVIVYMSNSVEFLIKKQPINALNQLNNLLNKIGQENIESLPKSEESEINKPVSLLFLDEYKNSTFKLWIAAFFGFLTLYTLMSWVPNIAKESGLPFEMATYVGIALNIGAIIGTLSLGFLSDKYGLKKVVVNFMICAFGVMLIYGNITLTTAIIFLLIGLIGIFVQGGFNGMYPILARVYPTEIRTTGVGLAVGVGRFGAILGPTLFGYLFDSGLSISNLFTLFSLPLLVTGLCVWSLKSKNLK